MVMKDLRSLVRRLLEAITVGDAGKMTSHKQDALDDTMIELVSDYIQKNKLFTSNGFDHYLPIEAKEYFDFIGFDGYKVIKMRANPKRVQEPWKDVVAVELWYLPPATPMKENMDIDMTFDAEEVANFVDDYIRRHKTGERHGAGPFRDYELPIDAKQAFDAIGFTRYKVERADNPEHHMFGKQYVVVPSWVKVD